MKPIPNSPIKEGIRKQYEAQAINEAQQINQRLNLEINSIQRNAFDQINGKYIPSGFVCAVLAVVFGIIGLYKAGCSGCIILGGAGIGLYYFWLHQIKQSKIAIQKEADVKIQELRDNADLQIRAANDDADRKTRQDIDWYDAEVKRNCQTMLKKPDVFKSMVDHSVKMFQRMVSHADSASNRKFVETDFTYRVELYGICYKYQSTYSNPQDDFNFDKQRYRNLTTREECEGLAEAIAKMSISRIKSLYPPNSMNISVSHVDAEVTLHFKAANRNYVPPRDIY